MNLNNESKTLFIPLLGKAKISKSKVFLYDPKAEEIIKKINYDFKKLKQTKWLSLYMSLRALIIDELCNKYLEKHPNSTVIHLGCGLDSRCLRVKQNFKTWYDIDYENVINIRKKYYDIDEKHKMIGSSVTNNNWIDKIENNENTLVVAEGLTMYLSEKEIKELISIINKKLHKAHLIFDAYTKKGVRLSKIKNPINQMNAKIKYGIDNSKEFQSLNSNLEYIDDHTIKKDKNKLKGINKYIFNHLYCGKISQKLYKIYEFKLNEGEKL